MAVSAAAREPRQIAHVISTSGGIAGAETVLLGLLAGGAERGWGQLVLNPSDVGDRTELAERVREHGRYAAPGGAGRLGGPAWVWRGLRGFGPDLTQAMLPRAAVLVGFIPRSGRGGVRTLSHQHGNHFAVTGRRAAAALDRRAGRRFDSVIACSEATAAFLRDGYGYPPALVRTIPNGWSGQPLPRAPSERPTVVCVARLRAQKGHADLVGALPLVLERIPGARLVLVGDGPQRQAIGAQVQTLGIGASVELVGASDDVWRWLAGADVFAIASHYEPLGIAALEAMAAGLPVVASATGGLPELVGDGGILVPPSDPARIAEALVRLLSDPGLARSLGAVARSRAAKRTMGRMVATYFDHYEELLEAAGPRWS